jgi:nucleoside-diphosphate-sugar epimerase
VWLEPFVFELDGKIPKSCFAFDPTEGLMKHILVTGGAGFIGSNVVKHANEQGLRITVIDSLRPSSKEMDEYIQSGIHYIQCDIRDLDQLNSIKGEFDSLIHLAAQVSVPKSFTHQKETEEINGKGTENVLALAEKLGIKRFILASSSAVYGDYEQMPLEESKIGTIQSPYAKTKLDNEILIEKLFAKGNEFLALRFFNVYGQGQGGNSGYAAVIPIFVNSLREGKEITIFGDGKQTRDFIHVSDVSNLLISLSINKWPHPKQHAFNVGSGQSQTILHVAKLVQKFIDNGKPLEIRFEMEREGDIRHSIASMDSTKEQLGWEPSIAFEEGLKRLIQGS